VATVDNIHWPPKGVYTTREQKAAMINILDRAAQMHFNAVILQVRPACDAMYDSKIEPWSEYLTGQMGKAPHPYYDPLAFAVEEAHKRGLELHAWFNPFRAHIRASKSPISPKHISATHPELVRTYGSYLWMDPTELAARQYSYNVIMDVVHRYNIDGVHFDDYFYPYPEPAPGSKAEMEFPDDAAWARYKKTGGNLSRNDWRRENVNLFVQQVYTGIKQEKPWVKFGIAPFGIWRPQNPPQITGFDSYDKLFCDSRKWLTNGWVDYIAPQLYWPIAQKAQSFPVLLNWWEEQNPLHRLLLSGMKGAGWKGVKDAAREAADEIVATRRQPGGSGEIIWDTKPHFAGAVAACGLGVYDEPAVMPGCPWLGNDYPSRPTVSVKQNHKEMKLYWKDRSRTVWQWVVQKKTGGRWTTEVLPFSQAKEYVPTEGGAVRPEVVAVTAVSRYGNLSEPAVFDMAQLKK
jgi:uncharacterized lipoprotein YddW (UPF0748 family)